MADIIQFPEKKSKATFNLEEVILRCLDDVSIGWERFARNNRLNDFFIESVPTWTEEGIDYLHDLNAISLIETRIGLDVLVFAPGTLETENAGWVAAFYQDEWLVETPSMVCETYARCFNILLFLKIKRELAG